MDFSMMRNSLFSVRIRIQRCDEHLKSIPLEHYNWKISINIERVVIYECRICAQELSDQIQKVVKESIPVISSEDIEKGNLVKICKVHGKLTSNDVNTHRKGKKNYYSCKFCYQIRNRNYQQKRYNLSRKKNF